ncbi:MAG: protein kinase family protein, partial [Candidatus Omnitrophica bacterium]|nr:protein kinase family protein [Candidatus Omnitrophota bacterium]
SLAEVAVCKQRIAYILSGLPIAVRISRVLIDGLLMNIGMRSLPYIDAINTLFYSVDEITYKMSWFYFKYRAAMSLCRKDTEDLTRRLPEAIMPLELRSIPIQKIVRNELARLDWSNMTEIPEEIWELMAKGLEETADSQAAARLRWMARAGLLRGSPLQGFLATTIVKDDQEYILVSNYYPAYATRLETALSLGHEIRALATHGDEFNLTDEQNSTRESALRKWLITHRGQDPETKPVRAEQIKRTLNNTEQIIPPYQHDGVQKSVSIRNRGLSPISTVTASMNERSFGPVLSPDDNVLLLAASSPREKRSSSPVEGVPSSLPVAPELDSFENIQLIHTPSINVVFKAQDKTGTYFLKIGQKTVLEREAHLMLGLCSVPHRYLVVPDCLGIRGLVTKDRQSFLKVSRPFGMNVAREIREAEVCLVQRALDGVNLDSRLRNLRYAVAFEGKKVPADSRILGELIVLGRAFKELHHAKYYHRDLKPGHIIILNYTKVGLIDFGIAVKEGGREPGLDYQGLKAQGLHTTGNFYAGVGLSGPCQDFQAFLNICGDYALCLGVMSSLRSLLKQLCQVFGKTLAQKDKGAVLPDMASMLKHLVALKSGKPLLVPKKIYLKTSSPVSVRENNGSDDPVVPTSDREKRPYRSDKLGAYIAKKKESLLAAVANILRGHYEATAYVEDYFVKFGKIIGPPMVWYDTETREITFAVSKEGKPISEKDILQSLQQYYHTIKKLSSHEAKTKARETLQFILRHEAVHQEHPDITDEEKIFDRQVDEIKRLTGYVEQILVLPENNGINQNVMAEVKKITGKSLVDERRIKIRVVLKNLDYFCKFIDHARGHGNGLSRAIKRFFRLKKPLHSLCEKIINQVVDAENPEQELEKILNSKRRPQLARIKIQVGERRISILDLIEQSMRDLFIIPEIGTGVDRVFYEETCTAEPKRMQDVQKVIIGPFIKNVKRINESLASGYQGMLMEAIERNGPSKVSEDDFSDWEQVLSIIKNDEQNFAAKKLRSEISGKNAMAAFLEAEEMTGEMKQTVVEILTI